MPNRNDDAAKVARLHRFRGSKMTCNTTFYGDIKIIFVMDISSKWTNQDKQQDMLLQYM